MSRWNEMTAEEQRKVRIAAGAQACMLDDLDEDYEPADGFERRAKAAYEKALDTWKGTIHEKVLRERMGWIDSYVDLCEAAGINYEED